MTEIKRQGGAKTWSGASDDMVTELTKRQSDMAEAMQRLLRFQRQTLILKNADSMDDAFDAMESLLLQIVDFAFATLQARDDAGNFSPLREIKPDEIVLDPPLMEWVLQGQEVSVLPIDLEVGGHRLRSLVCLPFGAKCIMLLWMEQAPEEFTQEQEALLSVLSREMAAIVDASHYRQRIEKTRAAMSDIIESVPLGLLSLDHQNRIQMINSTAEIALDVRRQEAVGKEFAEALPPGMALLLARMIADDSREEEEFAKPPESGEEQVFGVTISPMQSQDESNRSGKVVVCRDLQLSREVRKLRELDAMKNDFLSLVSHELRTPLTSILAYSETLLMEDDDNMPKEWREYLDVIHGEGRRLCRLIDDVLDLTKMEAGKMVYDFEMHDPNEIVGTVVMTLMPLIEGKNHHLEMDLGEGMGDCRLAVDRFTQVVNNIVSNAIKYTEPGGRIVIRTYKDAPFPGSSCPTMVLEVDDDGIGISEENLDKVFSKFEMVETIKNHSSGTGLGMAICKRIIEEGHSGKIWLDSKVGAGTKVFVRIPFN